MLFLFFVFLVFQFLFIYLFVRFFLNYIMIIIYLFRFLVVCVWLLFVYLCLFVYLFTYLGSIFLGFLPLCFCCHTLWFHIFGDMFHCRIDVYLGPQITLKISAWTAKNLKALKGSISLTKALIIIWGFHRCLSLVISFNLIYNLIHFWKFLIFGCHTYCTLNVINCVIHVSSIWRLIGKWVVYGDTIRCQCVYYIMYINSRWITEPSPLYPVAGQQCLQL